MRITDEIDFTRTDLKLFNQLTLKNKKGITQVKLLNNKQPLKQ